MTDMTEIEQNAREYADAHSALVGEVSELNEAVETVKRAHTKRLRELAYRTAKEHERLAATIEAAAELFAKPKSRILAGIRVGFRKKKGSVTFRDEAKTIERAKRLLPADQVALLIRTRESVDKSVAGDLTGADLKRLGIQIEADHDEVVIQPPNAAIGKQAAALIKDADKRSAA
jgi:hypothetical protein